jgi:hypothetical protein
MKVTNIEESKTLVDDALVSGNREEWASFLNSLPDNPAGGLSLDKIQAYINQERASWDDKK